MEVGLTPLMFMEREPGKLRFSLVLMRWRLTVWPVEWWCPLPTMELFMLPLPIMSTREFDLLT